MIHVRPTDLRPPFGIAPPLRRPPTAPAPRPAGSLWARVAEGWRFTPESQNDYDARQW